MFERFHAFEAPRKLLACVLAYALVLGSSPAYARSSGETATPIKHLVVIFQENVSFDHYFGTYPNALNPNGEPQFFARPNTPTVNGLSGALLNNNPNLNPANGNGATNPFRLDRTQAATADQNHNYGPEQAAYHFGLMDLFPISVGTAGPPPNAPPQIVLTKGLNLGYYDGNTVTALWNYAQYFAMSDNSYDTTFGPSTPGLMNLVSGQTNGVAHVINGTGSETDGGNGTLTVIGDPDPIDDVCSAPSRNQVQMQSRNIGDMLNDAGITWGSFMGGFDLTIVNPNGTTGCLRSTTSAYTGTIGDYVPHHAFFQYWASTANPQHTRPQNVVEIGHDGPANHNYDMNDFYAAVKNGNLPAVSFLKAQAYQDGHAGNSDPIDEQTFIVNVLNTLQQSPDWSSTAVVILYDDSDGWYDHVTSPIVNQSNSPADMLTGPGACGDGSNALAGPDPTNPHAQGRCGYGPRQPLVIVSPWARENFVDHTVTDQTSVIRFIEDNWLSGKRIGQGSYDVLANSISQMFDFNHLRSDRLFLNPATGEPITQGNH
ncbi:MAG TPA: alkaline phosphatase family protein [Terriglobales bacterium]|nr:alkaline phosphatase family protein [Terriglobales bacterium]